MFLYTDNYSAAQFRKFETVQALVNAASPESNARMFRKSPKGDWLLIDKPLNWKG